MAITKIEVPELFDFGSDNSAFKLPTGTTAERPTSPSNGEMRFNTTTGYVEYYDTTDTQWWEIDYETLCTTNDPNYPITNLAYYKMSNASDSGEGSGYIGQGGIFNGSSSYINTTYTIPAISTYSLSLWFKTSITGIRQYLFADFNSSANTSSPRLTLAIAANNNFQFYLGNGSSNWTDSSSASALSYLDGNWHNLVLVINGTSVKLYADGNTTPIADLTSTVSAGTAGTSPVSIGRIGDYPLLYFNGSIDQVRIFNTALSSSNVSLLYAETSATSSTLDYPVTATALYELSGNANDTGNTYNGTATNVEYAYNGTATNVNFNVAGKFGNAGEFNGSSSFINAGFIPSLVTQTFSISTWIKFSSLTNNQAFISNYVSSGGTSRGWFFRYNTTDGIQFAFRNSTTDVSLSNGYHPIIGQWVHICVSVSPTSKTLYINGVSNATLGADNIVYLGNQETYFGRLGILSLQYFGGSIDQVRIFDSALNASQVTQLYNEIQCVPTIVPSENFTPITYTGTGGAQSTNSLSSQVGSIDFAPDLVWIKQRNGTINHFIVDSLSNGQYLRSDTGQRLKSAVSGLSLSTNGFNITLGGTIYNSSSGTYVAWNWKAGGAPTATNSAGVGNVPTSGSVMIDGVASTATLAGSIAATKISANTAAGFSIVSYTGGANNQTIGHSLNEAPEFIVVKNRDTGGNGWATQSPFSGGAEYHMMLNLTQEAKNNVNWIWNNFEPTSTVFGVGRFGISNQNGDNFIAYCFHSVDGFSKIGSYTGTRVQRVILL